MHTEAKILIVDDTITNLHLLKKHLKEYNVVEAADGRTALKLVQAEQPDIVLLDIMMPGVDGHSVLTILKNNESTQHLPVMLISSLDSIEEKVRAFAMGADDYINKPFNPLEVKARVNALLRTKTMQDEISRIPLTLASLVSRVESRSALSDRHGLRTAYYAEQLSKLISYQKTDHDRMRIAALLHDVGYMQMRDELREKQGSLDVEELALIKTHPVHGADICSAWPGMKYIVPWVRHHHERYDGNGYPNGLCGADIPIGARILSIADAFDALTSARPYRQTYTQSEALVILLENAGSQWDPDYVSLFCKMADGMDLRTEAEKYQL